MSDKNISTEEFAISADFAPDTVLNARRVLAIDRMTEALQHIADELARSNDHKYGKIIINHADITDGMWREKE